MFLSQVPQEIVMVKYSKDHESESMGYQIYRDQIIPSLRSFGDVEIVHCTINESLVVFGMAKIKDHTDMNELQVKGSIEIDKTIVRGPVNIQGYLEASHSQFLSPMTVTSKKCNLHSCQTKGIIIKEGGSHAGEEKITLTGNTQVEGPIIFESGNGKVVIRDSASVKGVVQGGVVVRE